MIGKLIETCLENRLVVIGIFACLVAYGIFAIRNTPVDAIPDIGENQQIVFTDWPGRSPKDIEDQITYPLSVALQGLPYVKSIRGSSAFGFSIIYVIFQDNVDFYWTRTRVLEKLATAQRDLPEGVIPELGPDATGLGQVFWYTLEGGGKSLVELRSLQDWYVRYQLQSVAGVSEVASVGGFVKQYQIDVDPNRLFSLGHGIADVFNAVRRSNIDVGAKVIEESKMEFIVRGIGFIKNVKDIENIVLGEHNGIPTYIKNIANVRIGPEFRRNVLDKAGSEVVGGVVIMRYGENPKDVIDRVKLKILEITEGLPEGVKIVPFYDRTELVNRTLGTLSSSLMQAIAITIGVIFLFLRNMSSSLIVSVTLPLSVLVSLSLLYLLGMDSNIMSLSGIIIAIGTMVDMGIVLVENIYRHMSMPENEDRPRIQVVKEASLEVAPAVVTAVLTTVISFIPVFALEGQEGKLFHPLAFTKTFALFGSILVTLTLVPVLATFVKRRKTTSSKPSLIIKRYCSVLKWCLAHPKRFLALPVLLVIVALSLFLQLGREFMPPLNEGDILFMPVMLPSVSLTEARRILQHQDRIISEFQEVRQVVGKLGRADTATDPAPISMFETMINLKPRDQWRKGMTREKLILEMNKALRIPGVANIWTQPISNRVDMLSTGIRTQVGVKVFGRDLAQLEAIAKEVEGIVKDVPGVADLYSEKIVGKPYIEIKIDREKTARFGVRVGDVQDVIQSAVGGVNLTHTLEGRERYPVRVRYPRELRDSEEAIMRVLVPTSGGRQIPLGQLATVERVMGPAMINSENGLLRAYVLMNVRGRDLIGFVEEASKRVRDRIKLPKGYYLSWSGQFENEVRARSKLMILVPLSLLVNFLILFVAFRSFSKTITIFLAVPVAFSGGIILLWLFGFNMSVAVAVGFIALFGIAVDDGVVMTTYLDDVMRRNPPKDHESLIRTVIDGASKRIRPVLMTTVTTIVALVPVLVSLGAGSEVMKPMAIPTVGGMFVILLSGLMVPVCYYLNARKQLA